METTQYFFIEGLKHAIIFDEDKKSFKIMNVIWNKVYYRGTI